MPSVSEVSPVQAGTVGAISRSLSLIQGEVADTAARVSVQELAALAGELAGAPRVFVAGAGRSGLVLRMAAMRLMHLGLTVHVAGDTTTPAIGAGDLLLVASGSGTTSGVVRAGETAVKADARVAAFTANAGSPLGALAHTLVIVPAPQKTDHGSGASQQYSGSLFEQVLFLAAESVFQALWEKAQIPADQLWTRHANLE
ncbi:6-phospho-3-hexuloisomerase [Pseudarthrobacter defluvii]|uniref:6-phospho-3-hexuloisomerase n=1 Tax=Pseudarthrobacter defluvii TaxID=410837 RepID=UPI0027875C89|nr:6-phospho-3-hexuloisomerase [Pseudarthrobacter defluvii]MDQ0769474.1 6-phospho-3-hexuloisomerase [Pseudarthrobacter defluvii]